MFTILTGYVPFKAPSIPELYKLVLKAKYTVPDHVSPPAADLISKMLHLVPQNRATIKDILEHVWFVQPQEADETIQWPEFKGSNEKVTVK